MYLERVREPSDLRGLSYEELDELAGEIRDFVVSAVSETGGHLGSNLGAVELTLAIHRVFESPTDALVWDTGHQAYVHKIVTGRQAQFEGLRQAGGLSGYPSREESEHDHVENSHASTSLSYAYGMAVARDLGVDPHRHIVAVIGDGSMTGGMAYEALNNIGHGGRRVIIVLNDNGRSYAPTVSNLAADTAAAVWSSTEADADPEAGDAHTSIPDRVTDLLAHALTDIRLNPVYVRRQRRLEEMLQHLPVVGHQAGSAMDAVKAGVREFLQPPSFFEALGVRTMRSSCRPRARSSSTCSRRRVVVTRRRRTTTRSISTTRPSSTRSSGHRRRSPPATHKRSPRRSSRRPRPMTASSQ
jgi:1-deoxy-D-xylulose-5-phosphate synthase